MRTSTAAIGFKDDYEAAKEHAENFRRVVAIPGRPRYRSQIWREHFECMAKDSIGDLITSPGRLLGFQRKKNLQLAK